METKEMHILDKLDLYNDMEKKAGELYKKITNEAVVEIKKIGIRETARRCGFSASYISDCINYNINLPQRAIKVLYLDDKGLLKKGE